MKRLFQFLFGRGVRVVNVPEICGPRLSLSEVKAALHGALDDVKIRSLLQILAMKREACEQAASLDAWQNQDTRYQLGGKQCIDDLFAELELLIKNGKASDPVKSFFRSD
jgi:hypothetical protein